MYYVISDIHGCHDELLESLTHWNRKSETLVILGDLIDRGPDSMLVIQTLMKLKKDYPEQVVILRGNHDIGLTAWLLNTDEDELAFYYMPTHAATLQSFFGNDFDGRTKFKNSSRQQRAMHLRYKHKAELQFLAGLDDFHETEHCIFVHAGINLEIPDWRDDMRAMTSIRDPFIYSSKIAPKKVFFGHTPTGLIRDDKYNTSVWISPNGDKVGIDGGCAFGHELHAVRVNLTGDITEIVSVRSKKAQYA